jgi:hypothetical protein
MNWYHREPTLNEILSDCIIRAVMEADGIDPQELAATLRQVGRKLVPRLQPDGGLPECIFVRGQGRNRNADH